MLYTKNNIIDGIYAKIDSLYEDENTRRMWKTFLPNYPKEIEQNVLEWVNNQPITHVDCYGESVLRIMNGLKLDESWIPQIINGFILFAETKFTYPAIIANFISSNDLV